MEKLRKNMTIDNAGLGTIISTDIVVLNDHERTLVKYAFEQLNEEYKSTVLEIGKKPRSLQIHHFRKKKLKNLERLL